MTANSCGTRKSRRAYAIPRLFRPRRQTLLAISATGGARRLCSLTRGPRTLPVSQNQVYTAPHPSASQTPSPEGEGYYPSVSLQRVGSLREGAVSRRLTEGDWRSGRRFAETKRQRQFFMFRLSDVSSGFIVGRRAPFVIFGKAKNATSLPEGGFRCVSTGGFAADCGEVYGKRRPFLTGLVPVKRPSSKFESTRFRSTLVSPWRKGTAIAGAIAGV